MKRTNKDLKREFSRLMSETFEGKITEDEFEDSMYETLKEMFPNYERKWIKTDITMDYVVDENTTVKLTLWTLDEGFNFQEFETGGYMYSNLGLQSVFVSDEIDELPPYPKFEAEGSLLIGNIKLNGQENE